MFNFFYDISRSVWIEIMEKKSRWSYRVVKKSSPEESFLWLYVVWVAWIIAWKEEGKEKKNHSMCI